MNVFQGLFVTIVMVALIDPLNRLALIIISISFSKEHYLSMRPHYNKPLIPFGGLL